MSGTIPIVMTAQGRQPTAPATLWNALIALAQQMSPGLTANLPALLIEDLASTGTAGVVLCDQAVTELINSLTPLGANLFLLLQLGAIYGVPQGQQSNPSVYVVFTIGEPLASLVWSAGTVTATTVSPHGFTIGNTVQLTIIGAIPVGYNGTFTATITGTTTFTFPLVSNPGIETVPGNYTPGPSGGSFTVNQGFTVSDGSYQYVVQDGGVIGSSGSTEPLFCLATIAGTWAIPDNTVTTIVTALPSGVSLTCTNPTAGLPGQGAQSDADYRSLVLQSGLAVAQGLTTLLKAALARVPGVQQNLISVRQIVGSGWEVIVGGGDPYAVGEAIFESGLNIATLVGSTIEVTAITKATPGVVTTDLNHGLAAGNTIEISGVTPSNYNGTWVIPASPPVTEKTFPIGDTSSFPVYVSGGTVEPNNRNITVSINDFPDQYEVIFVNPPQQLVTISLLWNSTAPNLISNAAVAAAAAPALMAYINAITVGQPINLFELQDTFTAAVVNIIPTNLLTRMVFAVSINGISTPPEVGTGIIATDPESYCYTTLAQISIMQG